MRDLLDPSHNLSVYVANFHSIIRSPDEVKGHISVQGRHTTLKMLINLIMTFNYCMHFPQNLQSMLIVNISRSIEM